MFVNPSALQDTVESARVVETRSSHPLSTPSWLCVSYGIDFKRYFGFSKGFCLIGEMGARPVQRVAARVASDDYIIVNGWDSWLAVSLSGARKIGSGMCFRL